MITETRRDTTVVVRPDSATVEALLRCDSTNNELLVELLRVTDSYRLSADIDVKARPAGGAVLTVDCRTDSLTLEIEMRDREIRRLQSETHTVVVPRELTGWQRTFIAIGILSAALLAVGVIMKIRK